MFVWISFKISYFFNRNFSDFLSCKFIIISNGKQKDFVAQIYHNNVKETIETKLRASIFSCTIEKINREYFVIMIIIIDGSKVSGACEFSMQMHDLAVTNRKDFRVTRIEIFCKNVSILLLSISIWLVLNISKRCHRRSSERTKLNNDLLSKFYTQKNRKSKDANTVRC